jgi:3-methyladenine DNA glycosylase AlkC
MKKKFSLKDHLFNRKKIEYLAGLFVVADKQFKEKEFVEEVMTKLLKLELKERIVWIAEVLERYLPQDFSVASKVIVKALPVELDSSNTDDDFGDFIFAPLGEFVVRNGLSKKHLNDSFFVLHELTRRFSMEDAMRAFINTFPNETLKVYARWAKDKNYHVRRLVSESTRPLLPWSRRISLTTTDTLLLLENLYTDKTRYVTRSVSNHLNDIAKKEPKLVVKTLEKWKKEGRQLDAELAWMTKHALRTLVKDGNKDALSLLGYANEVHADVQNFSLDSHSKKIAKNGHLSFLFTLNAQADEDLLIDYVIDFVKKGGGVKPKVFKLKKVSLKKGEMLKVSKKHRFIEDATTYTLYSGLHTLTLQINGKKCRTCTFEIV